MTHDAPPHPVLPANENGRDFIVADLHGHRLVLDRALEARGFDPAHDRLLSVGDLIDRGPDSPGCLDLLTEPWFYAVRGNHEQMMIDALRSDAPRAWGLWRLNGGDWAQGRPRVDLERWAGQVDALPYTLTVEHRRGRVGLCHAQYRQQDWNDRLAATEDDRQDWLWGRTRVRLGLETEIAGVDWVFHGHTIVPRVTRQGNAVFIDRGAYAGGPLAVLSLDDWMAEPSTRRVNQALDHPRPTGE